MLIRIVSSRLSPTRKLRNIRIAAQRLFDASRTFKVRRCMTPTSTDGRMVPDMLTVVLPIQLQTPRTVVVDIVSEGARII